MNKCNCECHKKSAESDLKKCQENNKKKNQEISSLKKKVFAMTIAIAVVAGVVSKESIDKMIEYFQTYDKVKQAIDGIGHESGYKMGIPMPVYYGSSPSPGTMGVFAVALLAPTKRRV